MNRQNIIILSIIAIGSVSSIAYATSTVISDSGITTPSLTATTVNVTGTCVGCGGAEANYSTWTLQYNKTYGSAGFTGGPKKSMVDNNGYVFTANRGDGLVFLLNPSGTIISTVFNAANYIGMDADLVQSETGFYRAVFDGSNGTIYLYKNNLVTKTFAGGNCDDCNGFYHFTGNGALAISPNGQYFVISGENSTNDGTTRVLLYKGS